MILSGKEIIKQQGKGLTIAPFDERRVNPNSYNLTLADELLMYCRGTCDLEKILDMKAENKTLALKIPDSGLVLNPGYLYLGRTVEYTETPAFVPILEGRSSIGRLGVSIHITAGFGDIGFCGYWTLELSCVQPVRIYAGIEIAQICYHTICGDYQPYSGKYQGNREVQASMLYREAEK